MRMNYDYCYLDDNGSLRYMPMILKDGDSYRVNPPQEVYAAHGGYKKTAAPPEPVEGVYWAENEPKDWVWDDTAMTVAVTYHEGVVPEPEPIVRKWTPLTLKRGAEAKGWWGAFKAKLEANGGYEDFLMCQYVAEDDAMFPGIYNALCDALGKDEVDAYLAELPTEA